MKKCLILALSMLTCGLLSAQVYVTNPADAGAGTLRDAVATATAGQTIYIQTSSSNPIMLSSKIVISKDLNFVGIPGHSIIDGGSVGGWGLGAVGTRLLEITPGVSVEINNLILQNASYDATTYGGGAIWSEGILTATNCTFRNNIAGYNFSLPGSPGGAITSHETGSLTLSDCTFENNRVGIIYSMGGGGAVYFASPAVPTPSSPTTDLVITGCDFIGNVSGGGGAIYVQGPHGQQAVGHQMNCYIANSTFKGNFADNRGGALVIYGNIFTDLTNSIFTGNSAAVNNSSSSEGGAIAISTGIFAQPADQNATLTNLTITNNYADLGGGIAVQFTSKNTIENCIIAGNQCDQSASLTADLFLEHINIPTFPLTELNSNGHNIIGIAPPSSVPFTTVSSDFVGTLSQPFDPEFIQMGSVPPSTDGDYHLTPCSPGINSGDNAGVPFDEFNYFGNGTNVQLAEDVEGNPRFFHPNPAVVDRGAYENVVPVPGFFFYPNNNQACQGKTFASPNTGGLVGTFTSQPAGLAIDPGTGEISHKFSAVGTYAITFNTFCGTTSHSWTIGYTIHANPTVTITETINPFWPQNTTSLNAVVTSGTGPFTYYWTRDNQYAGSNSQILNPCAGATYTVVVTDQSTGCQGVYNYFFNNTNNPACSSGPGRGGLSGLMLNDNTLTETDAQNELVSDLENVEASETWTVYPNPTSGILTADLGNTYEEVQIVVTDLTGKTIYQRTTQQNNKLNLDLQAQPAGVYFVTLTASSAYQTFKVIKK